MRLLFYVPLVAGILIAALTPPRAMDDPDCGDAVTVEPKFVPCLWFADQAEEAIRFYGSIFSGFEVLNDLRTGPDGSLIFASFRLAGQEFIAVNGNDGESFTDAVSIVVRCDGQGEIDELWRKLTADGGRPGRCGWLEDRYGVSWQIVPRRLCDLLGDPDPARAKRIADALRQMEKVDIAELERAGEGR